MTSFDSLNYRLLVRLPGRRRIVIRLSSAPSVTSFFPTNLFSFIENISPLGLALTRLFWLSTALCFARTFPKLIVSGLSGLTIQEKVSCVNIAGSRNGYIVRFERINVIPYSRRVTSPG